MPPDQVARLRTWMLLACILVGYTVSLARAVDYDLVWDDVPEIQNNPIFDRPLHEGLLLTQVERGAPDLADLETLQFAHDSYRPLTYASYWTDIAIWGRSPRALHRTNIVLGALAILLAFLVTRRWIGARLAWLPTACFALHPVQIETIAYVSARGDLLAGIFALASTYALFRAIDTTANKAFAGWIAVAVLAFAASLLSKETYLALPAALAVIAWSRSGRAQRWWVLAPLFITAIAYVPFRSAMISVHEPAPLLDALAGIPRLVIDSLRITLLPFDLSIERTVHTSTVMGWALLSAATAVLVGSWWRARSRHSTTGPARALTGLCWFIVLLGPASVVVERTGAVADRYLYLPLLGVAVGITVTANEFVDSGRARRLLRPLLIGAGVVWSAIVLAVAWMQVPVWRNASSLYRHALAMEGSSSSANYRVAVLEIDRDRWDLAVPLLERAIELDSHNVAALNNLGVYYLRNSRAGDAERMLLRAVEANPARFRAWTNLGLSQLANGEHEAGCRSIARALVINPSYLAARRARAQSCDP
jgi:protein O-mannosyl-transferase